MQMENDYDTSKLQNHLVLMERVVMSARQFRFIGHVRWWTTFQRHIRRSNVCDVVNDSGPLVRR